MAEKTDNQAVQIQTGENGAEVKIDHAATEELTAQELDQVAGAGFGSGHTVNYGGA